MNPPRKRLGEMLLDAGIIDQTQLKAALGHQRQWGVRLGQALVDLKLTTEADIVHALALKFGLEEAHLDALEPYALEQALKLVPREFAVRNNVLPLAADTASITVAMSDPTNLAIVDEIRFRTGRRVKVTIGGDREVAEALRRHYPGETVEAIALELEPDDADPSVFESFGGGSKAALEAFFTNRDGRGAQPAPEGHAPGASGREAAAAAAPPAAAPPPAGARAGAAPAPRGEPAPPRPGAPRGVAGAAPAAAPLPAAAKPSAAPARTSPVAGAPAPQPRPVAKAAPAGPQPQPGPARAPAASPAPPPARAAARIELELEPASGVREARAALLGTVPSGGFSQRSGAELAAKGPAAGPTPATDPAGDDPSRALTPRELAILDALDRLAGGAPVEPEIVKPVQAMAAVIRLLLRKHIVSEQEFLDELSRK